MLKASALYIVIVIALVIGLICFSLIVIAFLYKSEYQKKIRYHRLNTNLNSGINILLASNDTAYSQGKSFSLYTDSSDTVSLKKNIWGIYTVAIAKAFQQRDTVYKVFSIGKNIDSAKWAALYLIDEDRPFSLSGNSVIRGTAYIPKAGVQQAYVDNKAYTGDQRLIIGIKHTSNKVLPALNKQRLKYLEDEFKHGHSGDSVLSAADSIRVSFLNPTLNINFKKKPRTLQNIFISGNIVIYSDTSVTIENTAKLTNVAIFAKSIVVQSGFKGDCQLFASDSVSVGKDCSFNYPTCIGVLRFNNISNKLQEKIIVGENSLIQGVVFTYEKQDNPIKPLIELDKSAKIIGEIYSQGIALLQDSVKIAGSIFTSRFLYKSAFTVYENYLINATIDEQALSHYYLTNDLLPCSGKKKKVLQWLERN